VEEREGPNPSPGRRWKDLTPNPSPVRRGEKVHKVVSSTLIGWKDKK
jgi:hypothetical protein